MNDCDNKCDCQPCEDDCKHVCFGCARLFHDIKDEEGLPHHEELSCTERTDAGNYYCHIDCLRDSR